jgi:hypothetical protein
MGMGKLLGSAAVLAAMAVTSTPAEAQRWRRHHHHDGTGNFILGALLGGVIVAAASSSNRRERERSEAYDEAPPADAPPATEPVPAVSSYADVTDADSAADACAAAAESAGTRYARIARVGSIGLVEPAGASWRVNGTIELRNDYRSRGADHGFTCFIAGAGMPTVKIEGYP